MRGHGGHISFFTSPTRERLLHKHIKCSPIPLPQLWYVYDDMAYMASHISYLFLYYSFATISP